MWSRICSGSTALAYLRKYFSADKDPFYITTEKIDAAIKGLPKDQKKLEQKIRKVKTKAEKEVYREAHRVLQDVIVSLKQLRKHLPH